jgi:hypothetical protein
VTAEEKRMWLRTPDAIGETMWEGQLEPEASSVLTQRRPGPSEVEPDITRIARDLPMVSIGRPDTWLLTDLYEPDQLPATVRTRLQDTRFLLVRLSCSFRPVKAHTRIDWARLAVSLMPDDAGRVPVAVDVHPLLVTHEGRRNVKVSLSPTLKFAELEAGAGGVDFGVEYPEIQPVISASGVGEATPAWDFSAAPGAYVHGSKWMHLLVGASPAMSVCDARVELTADVVRSGFRIATLGRPKQTSADPLTTRLFG